MNTVLVIILSIISLSVIYYVLFGYKKIKNMGGLTIILGLFFISGCVASDNSISECRIDEDCVPATACHASECVPKELGINKEGVFCTLECKPGTMDCGQGRCGCVNERCEVIWT